MKEKQLSVIRSKRERKKTNGHIERDSGQLQKRIKNEETTSIKK